MNINLMRAEIVLFAVASTLLSLTLPAADISDRNFAPSPRTNAAMPGYFRTGVLDMESRVWAETQIERVYYNHRIWPKENSGLKPTFEVMVHPELIAKKAQEPLRMSAALKQLWSVEITPAMLQTEMDRM